MKRFVKVSLSMLLLFFVAPINVHASLANFAITNQGYSYNADMESIIDAEFGSNYRLADWTAVVTYYSEGNDMDQFFDLLLDGGGNSAWVSRNGSEFYSSWRHYFINLSNHNTPSGFLVHDHIDNHLIDLGSWENSRPILAYTDNPVPIPGAMWLLSTSLIGLFGLQQIRRKS